VDFYRCAYCPESVSKEFSDGQNELYCTLVPDPNHVMKSSSQSIIHNGIGPIHATAFKELASFNTELLKKDPDADISLDMRIFKIDKQNVPDNLLPFSEKAERDFLEKASLLPFFENKDGSAYATFCKLHREYFEAFDRRGLPPMTRYGCD
jgi:hypothetical protein